MSSVILLVMKQDSFQRHKPLSLPATGRLLLPAAVKLCHFQLHYSKTVSFPATVGLCRFQLQQDSVTSRFSKTLSTKAHSPNLTKSLEVSDDGVGWFLYVASSQRCDIRLSGSPSSQGAGDGLEPVTFLRFLQISGRNRSLSTGPPMPP
ncbi:hypothetical protein PoB_004724500 [Plakobranchus ocellatus]|uniref:Uncharacterized protein n=1 Tax=Plakobranchus ocellatus TaxID=259542 RepID=A0AAV4BJP3_9GAST|nr:hypothetical protein PoB_004724500 [Plakobranchus ocellatus]